MDVIQIRGVTDTMKAKLRELGRVRFGRTSASHVVKELIREALAPVEEPRKAALQEPVSAGRAKKERLQLRLLPGERAALDAVAESRESSTTHYTVSLIRAHLAQVPALQGDEIQALRESNGLLLALGRNLNQIARHLNATGASGLTTAQIADLDHFIRSHAAQVAAILEQNRERWDIAHVDL